MKALIPALFSLIAAFSLPNCCSAQSTADPSVPDPPAKLVKQIFPGARLSGKYIFRFPGQYEEKWISTKDSTRLNALLFRSDSARGVIFYLHGNTDGLDKWGKIARTYTDLHYDLFMMDYRGYGKSESSIKNETQLYSDVQNAYDLVKASYPETKIIVLGYSIGTGPAAMLAANNHPAMLILQAPYFSLADAVHHLAPSWDTTKLPFSFKTYEFIQRSSCPIVIFHGDADKEFYYGSSEKLKHFFKPGDELITLKGAGHLNMDKNKDYLEGLNRILR